MAPLLKLAPFMMRVNDLPVPDKVMFAGAIEVTDGLAPVWAFAGPERDRKRTVPGKTMTERRTRMRVCMFLLIQVFYFI